MSLTETKSIDLITVTEKGTIQVRETTRIIRDGEQIAQTYNRWTFFPGDNVSEMPQNVQDICNVAWTPEVIAAYQASLPQSNTEAA